MECLRWQGNFARQYRRDVKHFPCGWRNFLMNIPGDLWLLCSAMMLTMDPPSPALCSFAGGGGGEGAGVGGTAKTKPKLNQSISKNIDGIHQHTHWWHPSEQQHNVIRATTTSSTVTIIRIKIDIYHCCHYYVIRTTLWRNLLRHPGPIVWATNWQTEIQKTKQQQVSETKTARMDYVEPFQWTMLSHSNQTR